MHERVVHGGRAFTSVRSALLASSQELLTRGGGASSYVAYLLFAALVLVLAAFNFRHRKNVILLACW